MPFKSPKQRKYMHAKHPKIAKKWEHKYRAGGTVHVIGSGGASTEGTPNPHVFKDGGTCGPTKAQLKYKARYDALQKLRSKKSK